MRMHTKRLLAVLLVVVMVFAMMPVSNAAGETAPLKLDVVTSGRSVGDTLKVTVEVTEADVIADGKLSIGYDNNVLKYLFAEAGNAWSEHTELSLQTNAQKNKIIVAFAADNYATEGTLVNLFFMATNEGKADLELVDESYISGYENVTGKYALEILKDAPEHAFGEWTVVTPATCTTNGLEKRVCADCQLEETRLTAVLGHNYTSAVTAPTCTTIGYTTYTCGTCSHSYVSDIVAATGHDFESVVTAPTHKEMGYTTHTCKTCDYTYVDAYTAALEHEFTSEVTKEATCTEEGVMTFTCACGESYTQAIPVVPHDYTAVLTEPTCTTMGYTTYTCDCGHSYKANYVDAEGHNCTAETVSPTCTGYGYTTEKCQKCNYINIVDITQPTGHTWGQWVEDKAPSCLEIGVNKRVCEACQATEYETVAALGHNYEESVTAPTHREMGYTTHTCQSCGHSYVDSYTAALEHDYQQEVTKAPTCTEEGIMTFTCECGESYTVTLPKADHTYTTEVVEPTCVEYGYVSKKCDNCDHSYIESITQPTGHTEELVNVKPATCQEEGYTGDVVCAVCNEVLAKGEVLPIDMSTCPSIRFKDIDQKQWYHESIDYVLVEGIMKGMSKDTFSPGGKLTRGQMATILYRMAGEPTFTAENPFVDVDDNMYYADAVVWAYENGVVKGMSETVFAPDTFATREQVATFLYRYAKLLGLSVEHEGNLDNYPDADTVSDYAAEAMSWTVGTGIINGIDGSLMPRDTATRAQIATVIMRFETANNN